MVHAHDADAQGGGYQGVDGVTTGAEEGGAYLAAGEGLGSNGAVGGASRAVLLGCMAEVVLRG